MGIDEAGTTSDNIVHFLISPINYLRFLLTLAR